MVLADRLKNKDMKSSHKQKNLLARSFNETIALKVLSIGQLCDSDYLYPLKKVHT